MIDWIPRPQPAHWFRLLTAREDLPYAVSVLARQRAIEPQLLPHPAASSIESAVQDLAAPLAPILSARLETFRFLAERYQPFWPDITEDQPIPQIAQPLAVLDHALAAIQRWQIPCDPLIAQLQQTLAQRMHLELLADLADHQESHHLDLAPLQRVANPEQPGILAARMYCLPLEFIAPIVLPDRLLTVVFTGTRHRFLAAVGPSEALASLNHTVTTANGRMIDLPAWMQGTPKTNLPDIQERLAQCQEEIQRLQLLLALHTQRENLSHHLWAVANLQWFFQHVPAMTTGGELALITGWTNNDDQSRINQLLAQTGSRAIVSVGPSQNTLDPPLTLDNPPWAKPLEIFPRLLGIPGRTEVDPSRLLAVIAPLLFGYMFGDLGQGLFLALFGLWLALVRGHSAGWLLGAAGMAAALFGVVFGSVFGHEDWIPALWCHPMTAPLSILAVPLVGGVGMILTGMSLAGVQAHWRGHFNQWRDHEGSVIVLYIGLILAVLGLTLGWLLAAVGLVLYLVGGCRHQPSSCPAHAAELLEILLQLGVNTLSFSRVGAFALAHAGLSLAVISLSSLADNTLVAILIQVIGNGVILLLEGLVVSVQTTRLILFEFFIRFLKGDGRPFRPLPQPPH